MANLVSKLDYKPLREEIIVHSLFGNVKSAEHKHNVYRVHIHNMSDSYKCNIEVLDQSTICGDITSVTPGTWTKELEEQDIFLTDVGYNSVSLLVF